MPASILPLNDKIHKMSPHPCCSSDSNHVRVSLRRAELASPPARKRGHPKRIRSWSIDSWGCKKMIYKFLRGKQLIEHACLRPERYDISSSFTPATCASNRCRKHSASTAKGKRSTRHISLSLCEYNKGDMNTQENNLRNSKCRGK